jgi:hypothetical protein
MAGPPQPLAIPVLLTQSLAALRGDAREHYSRVEPAACAQGLVRPPGRELPLREPRARVLVAVRGGLSVPAVCAQDVCHREVYWIW